MTTGRTGSDYLNACLDNIKGPMTFCGKFGYHEFFENSYHKVDKIKVINLFLKKYKYLFQYNKIEKIDTKVNIKKFKNLFLKISQDSKINRKNFLINLYKAYHLTLNRKIKDAKVLIHHSHGVLETKKFLRDFPNSNIMITIRDPRANLKSGLINWFSYDSKRKSLKHTFRYMYRIRQDLKFANSKENKKIYIKLEEAGTKKTKIKICKFLNINYQKNINFATIANRTWKGDSLSKVHSKKGEFIKSVRYNDWKVFFKKSDLLLLDFLYQDYKVFGYKIRKFYFSECFKIFFKNFFLLSFEKKVLKKRINNLENYFYFITRVLYFLLIIFKLDFLLKNKFYN